MTMAELFTPFERLLVQVAAGALPVPATSSDGADVSEWRSDSRLKTMRAVVYLYGTAATVTGAWLWGYRHSRWHRLGRLNGGSDVPVDSATQGYAEVVSFVGIFSRLAVSGSGAASISTDFEPVELQT